ncbi:unnamed protein product, partial [Scytosiphon promiscuus]
VLGFDCEWAASLTSRRKVAVIQLSSLSGYTVIFQVKTRRGREGGVMPNALKELMEDPEIQLAGVGVAGDLGRIKTDYDVDGTGAVDVGALAGQHLGVPIGERSLGGLTASFLRRRLKKDGVRTSDWEASPLSDEQV